jgi:Tfp pilus assembly protein PilF
MSKIQQIQSMLAENDNDCFLNHALGLEYVKIEDAENALNHFNKVLSIDPNYVGTYYHLAKLYEALMQEEEAIATYQKGMEVATAQNEKHAFGELRSAFEEYTM